MSRSHPPTLLTLVRRTLREGCRLARGDVVLCACSGGPDSTAMLHALARLAPPLGVRLVAHGVDHGLRAEAPAELALAARVAESAGVPFGTTRVDVAPGSNVQARARAARHDALAAAARAVGAALVATGHTMDDRAETLVMRLLRGAGPQGLAVLPRRSPLPRHPGLELIRPLADARRHDILTHLARHAMPSAEDPTNADARFLRVRVRREVLPLLIALSPRVVEHLAALADMLAEPPATTPPRLGKAQRLAVARAATLGRPFVKFRVAGGHEVVATFADGRIVLTERR